MFYLSRLIRFMMFMTSLIILPAIGHAENPNSHELFMFSWNRLDGNTFLMLNNTSTADVNTISGTAEIVYGDDTHMTQFTFHNIKSGDVGDFPMSKYDKSSLLGVSLDKPTESVKLIVRSITFCQVGNKNYRNCDTALGSDPITQDMKDAAQKYHAVFFPLEINTSH